MIEYNTERKIHMSSGFSTIGGFDAKAGDGRQPAGRQAMRNVDHEPAMRTELAAAVRGLLDTVDPDADNVVSDEQADALLEVADLVTRGRTAVERDYQGSPLFAHALEMPTRFAKQLVQIVRGAAALRCGDPLAVAMRCAADSMPPLRLAVLGDVAEHASSPTADVVKRLQLPRQTVDRVLQELHLLGLLTVGDVPWGVSGVRWVYTLSGQVSAAALNALRFTRNVSTP